MEFIDLKEQYKRLKNEINTNIQKVLEHGKFIMGPEITELEKKLADYAGVKHAITCSNGTDALLIPLMAWGIGSGDAVFTTPFTFFATAEVIKLLGATPVFVDIDENTYNINPEALESAILKTIKEGNLKPRAIIPVDIFGQPADYDKLEKISKKYNLLMLEDAAQSFGAVYNKKIAGSFGDAASTSFFPAKPLGCYGDGGAVFTNNDELVTVMKSIRVHGQGSDKYENVRLGINGRLDTIQAAVLLAKLEIFNEEINLRNKVAAKYTRELSGYVKTPCVKEGCISTWAQYSVLAKDSSQKAGVLNNLKKNNIPAAVYYPIPLHLQTVFKNLGYVKGQFPVSENVCERIFSLPMHPYLSDIDMNTIVDVIKKSV
ncbi:MAG: DegT/DnrJ/EryC1/StrS family aminotransferase [Bacillota bacterium]|nr:DegT/DnrJ/EryC1/StrS family aminotransferase [Bacillota bacterium]